MAELTDQEKNELEFMRREFESKLNNAKKEWKRLSPAEKKAKIKQMKQFEEKTSSSLDFDIK